MLRMRPFMQLSIPEPPSYAELAAAIDMKGNERSTEAQAISTLDIADDAAKVARKEWEALGRLDAETARCGNCEDWWRASIKDIIRACIACSIAIATVKKGILNKKGRLLSDVLTAENLETGKRYHDSWIVPKLSVGAG